MDYHKLLETLLREKEGMLLTKDIIPTLTVNMKYNF